jgi:hypothetical protein
VFILCVRCIHWLSSRSSRRRCVSLTFYDTKLWWEIVWWQQGNGKKESLNLWSLISDELLKVKSLRSHNEVIHIRRKWSEVKGSAVGVGWLTQHHLSCPPVHPDLLTRLLIKAPQNFGFCRSKFPLPNAAAGNRPDLLKLFSKVL